MRLSSCSYKGNTWFYFTFNSLIRNLLALELYSCVVHCNWNILLPHSSQKFILSSINVLVNSLGDPHKMTSKGLLKGFSGSKQKQSCITNTVLLNMSLQVIITFFIQLWDDWLGSKFLVKLVTVVDICMAVILT